MDTSDQNSRLIRFKGLKLLMLYLPMIPLLGFSYWLHPQQWLTAPIWIYLVFAAFFALPLIGCVVLPRTYYLCLSSDGLLIQYVGSRRFYAWSEIEWIEVEYGFLEFLFLGSRLLLTLKTEHWNRGLTGYDVAIYCVFEISAKELGNLIEEWRQRHAVDVDM